MLDRVIRFSLTHRFVVLAATALVVVYGLFALRRLPVDVLPDLNRPTVHILTEVPGMAPEEVETVVTRHLEAVLNGMPGVTRIYSSSATGLAVVRAEFEWGTDLRFARLAVTERLQLARNRLPEKVTPVLTPTSSIMGEIQMVGLTSKAGKSSSADIRTFADWIVRPRLLTIPGVSQVTVMGGEQRQVQVLANAEKLRLRQIPITTLKERLSHISEASGGGFLVQGDKEWLIRNFGRVRNIEEIAMTPVAMHLGYPVLLKDVADVDFAPAPQRGAASVSGKPGVVLMVQKQPSGDTLRISRAVDEALAELQNAIPAELEGDLQIHPGLFKQAAFIENAIRNVEEALRDGSLMVFAVLVLFLLNLRTSLITLTAIPLSLLITFIVFRFLGIGVNTMTLGGLAIAIGELVDDAIVDVENVFRRLRENREREEPRPALQVVYEASSEIRNSIVLATVIVVLVFFPLFTLDGIEGILFVPIGIAYVVSLVASLLVSLTVTPVLSYYFLGRGKSFTEREGWVAVKLKAWDRTLLEHTLRHSVILMAIPAVLALGTLAMIPFFGRSFLPPFNEGSAMAEVNAKAGISLEASNRLAFEAEKALLTIPEVISTGRRTGRADEDDHAAGVNHTEFEIGLKPSLRSRAEIFSDLRSKLSSALPADVFAGVSQPVTHRLDHVLSGVKAQVAVKVVGPDLRILRQQAAEVRKALSSVPGVVDLQMESQTLFPQYKIFAMREDLAKYGILPGPLVESLEAMLQGVPVAKMIEQDRFLNIFLRLDENSRKDIDAIRSLPAHVLPTGQVIPLNEVTDIFETSGPNTIERENLRRRLALSFNTAGRDLVSVVEDAKKAVANNVKLASGYHLEFSGQYESQKQASRELLVLGLLSCLGIFVVLFAHFRSAFICFQIMLNVPLALIGSVIAVYLTNKTLSVSSLIAFITLCGIASRNGIMMISHYIHLMREENEPFSKEMVIRGSIERLIPVLMTAFSAILALLPLAFAADQPGKEILQPVAVVIIGGLLSSTLLDIFVTPAVFFRFGRASAERLAKTKERREAVSLVSY